MYKHILIATDGSDLAVQAVMQGLALAAALAAKATAVTVTESWVTAAPSYGVISFPVDAYERGVAAHAEQVLAGVVNAAKATGIHCDVVHVRDQFPAEGIAETAAARGCDLIVVASHGRRGLSRVFLGSEAYRLMGETKVPVLVIR